MSGVDVLGLPLAGMLDVIYHLAVDDLIPRTTVQVAEDRIKVYRRAGVRDELEDQLGGSAHTDSPALADPATWGALPEHQAAARAAMSFAGQAARRPV